MQDGALYVAVADIPRRKPTVGGKGVTPDISPFSVNMLREQIRKKWALAFTLEAVKRQRWSGQVVVALLLVQ